jgi:hypothetical protein
MSVNDTYRASSLEPEPELTAETTAEQIAELKELIPSGPVIAIDLDDVLCSTNFVVAQCKCIPLTRLTSTGYELVDISLRAQQDLWNPNDPRRFLL